MRSIEHLFASPNQEGPFASRSLSKRPMKVIIACSSAKRSGASPEG